MDKEEKLMRMLDMLDNPGGYTDRQLEEMLGDEDCRSYYDMMVTMRNACCRVDVSDTTVDREWDKLERRCCGRHRRGGMRNVAAAIAVTVAVSGIAYAAMRLGTYAGKTECREEASLSKRAVAKDSGTSAPYVAVPVRAELRTYDNVELDSILRDVAAGYGLEVSYKNEDVRHLRLFFQWNTRDSAAQVAESLGSFERVSVRLQDNRLTVE